MRRTGATPGTTPTEHRVHTADDVTARERSRCRVPSFGELDVRRFSVRGEVGSDHCRCALHTEVAPRFEGSAQLRFVGGGRTERSFAGGDGRGGHVTRPLGT